MNVSHIKFPLILILLGLAFFIPFLGEVHLFDWDEINFAEAAREMLLTGNYSQVQINFEPFWEKPPLFFWLQAAAMHLFGINEFAARFPNAVVGILTLLSLYFVGKKIKSPEFGFLWGFAHFGSFLPHLYFKSGIIDPLFNLLIFWGCINLFLFNNSTKNALLAGLVFGLAILTKGPVAILIGALVFLVLWISNLFKSPVSFKNLIVAIFAGMLTASCWFGYEIWKHGFWFVEQFVSYQVRLFSTPDAGHGQPFYYHFVVVLLGCFPSSIFALANWRSKTHLSSLISHNSKLMSVLFWVVMILFSITTTKIVHYSSMAYFSVSYFAAVFLYQQKSWSKTLKAGLLIIGGLFSIILAVVPLVAMNAEKIIPYIKDPFAVQNLQAQVNWTGYEWLIGVVYFLVIAYQVSVINNSLTAASNQQPVFSFQFLVFNLFLPTAVCLFLYGAFVVPKIEKYTQGAAIEFYEAKRGQNVTIEPLGFKSYAHLFYFQKRPQKATSTDSLLNRTPTIPTFFVTRIDRFDEFRSNPKLKILYQKNGFVFLESVK